MRYQSQAEQEAQYEHEEPQLFVVLRTVKFNIMGHRKLVAPCLAHVTQRHLEPAIAHPAL